MGKCIPLFVNTSETSGVLCISQSCVVSGTVWGFFPSSFLGEGRKENWENKRWIYFVCSGEQVGLKRGGSAGGGGISGNGLNQALLSRSGWLEVDLWHSEASPHKDMRGG